jgi:uncharacterized membrane protein YhaH (DUF805 family)
MSSNTSMPAYQPSPHESGGVPTIDQPYYGATIGVAVKRFFTKYATFSGRASRSEYWWWVLVAALVGVVLNIVSAALGGTAMNGGGSMSPGGTAVLVIEAVWGLVTIVPSLALAWRRLHDTNRSGAWYLLVLIPLVGGIILIVWFAGQPKNEGRRFDR